METVDDVIVPTLKTTYSLRTRCARTSRLYWSCQWRRSDHLTRPNQTRKVGLRLSPLDFNILAQVTRPRPQLSPLQDGRPRLPLSHRSVLTDNRTVVRRVTPTTLHNLTPDIRAHGIRLVEIKYSHTRSMSTYRDHSEHDPSRSPEDLNPWETPINRRVPHPLRYPIGVPLTLRHGARAPRKPTQTEILTGNIQNLTNMVRVLADAFREFRGTLPHPALEEEAEDSSPTGRCRSAERSRSLGLVGQGVEAAGAGGEPKKREARPRRAQFESQCQNRSVKKPPKVETDDQNKLDHLQQQLDLLMSQRYGLEQVRAVDLPFIPSIMAAPYPARFKMLTVATYHGSMDADEHLENYQAHMLIQNANEVMLCKTFCLTLSSTAQQWVIAQKHAEAEDYNKGRNSAIGETSCPIGKSKPKKDRAGQTGAAIEKAIDKAEAAPKSKTLAGRFRQYTLLVTTAEHLQDQIELLVWNGHLREIVEKAITPENGANRISQVRPYPVPVTGDRTNAGELKHIVHTIFGETATGDTTSSRRSYARDTRQVARGEYMNIAEYIVKMSRQDSVLITLTDNETNKLLHPHNDALVRKIKITDNTVKRVLINNGSSADILIMDTFTRLNIGGAILASIQTPLYGFMSECVRAAGLIYLLITIGDGPKKAT
ncbi:hypothetical protein TIFTF001_020559 [Ficus carica]|uniref:Uncharacterized protein n=1 Tax=Ficus carica TaxID=3494 RepID=A0AA88A8S7_FICCA|nr:hypothetical protein TIFTF001_020559 [Ficus carica]